jgi:hypothetical protein
MSGTSKDVQRFLHAGGRRSPPLPTKADPDNDLGGLQPLPRKPVESTIFCESVRLGQQVEYAKIVMVDFMPGISCPAVVPPLRF